MCRGAGTCWGGVDGGLVSGRLKMRANGTCSKQGRLDQSSQSWSVLCRGMQYVVRSRVQLSPRCILQERTKKVVHTICIKLSHFIHTPKSELSLKLLNILTHRAEPTQYAQPLAVRTASHKGHPSHHVRTLTMATTSPPSLIQPPTQVILYHMDMLHFSGS